MAIFNPNPNQVGPGEYTSASKGPGVNKAFEGLFSDVGNLVQGAALTADLGIKEGIKNDLYTQIDDLRNQFGVADGVKMAQAGASFANGDNTNLNPLGDPGAGKAGRGVPGGVAKMGPQIERLNAAYRAGQLGESYYLGRLESIVADVRSNNPGYREEIDSMVSKITGITPANALRKSLQADLDATARASQAGADKTDTFIRNNMEFLSPASQQAYVTGNYNPAQLMYEIGQGQSQKLTMDNRIKRLNIMSSEDGALRTESEQTWIMNAGTEVDKIISSGLKSMPNAATFVNGKPLSGPEAAQATAAMQKLRADADLRLNNLAANTIIQTADGRKMSIAAILGPQKLKEANASQLAKIDAINAQITAGHYANAEFYAKYLQGMNDEATAKIYSQIPQMQVFQAMQKTFGPQGMNYILTKDNSLLGDVVSTLKTATTMINSQKGAPAPAQTFSNPQMKGPGGLTSTQHSQWISSTVSNDLQIAVAPNTPREQSVNLLTNYFSENNKNFLDLFNPQSAKNLYTKMISPEIAKKVDSLGDVQLSGQYRRWAADGFVYVLKSSGLLDTFQNSIVSSPNYNIEYRDGRLIASWSGPGAGGTVGSRRDPNETPVIRNMNEMLAAYQNVLPKGDKGTELLLKTIEDAGLNLRAKDDPGVLDKVYKAIKNSVSPDVKTFDNLGTPAPQKKGRTSSGVEKPVTVTQADLGQRLDTAMDNLDDLGDQFTPEQKQRVREWLAKRQQ